MWGLFKKKGSGKEEEESLEPQVRNEVVPGALSLGWYYSEDKNEVQMARCQKDRQPIFML